MDSPKNLNRIGGLRERAEKLLQMDPEDTPTVQTRDVQALVQELQAHQMELELENEELREVQIEQMRTESALRESEERFRKVFDNTPTGIAIMDLEGHFEHCNQSYCRMLGYSEVELLKVDLPALIHSDDREENLAEMERLTTGKIPFFKIENRFVRKDGSPVWVQKFVMICSSSSGTPGQILALVTDFSERRRTARELRDREERLSAIWNAIADAIVTIDGEDIIVDANPAVEHIFGYSVDELLGKAASVIMPSHLQEAHENPLAGRQPMWEHRADLTDREAVGQRKDGSTFPMELIVGKVEGLGLYTGIMRDVTTRRVLEQEVANVAEEERLRIAHDLHDDLGSILTGLMLSSEAHTVALAREGFHGVDASRSITELAATAISKARNLARGLRPVGSDPEDLVDALRVQCRRVESVSKMRCRFHCPQSVVVHDGIAANHIYRIAQEAVTNAVKHSGGTLVVVALRKNGDVVELKISDDGAGFDSSGGQDPGLGLRIMSYRARAVNGSLRVEPGETGGTRVVCTVPQTTPQS